MSNKIKITISVDRDVDEKFCEAIGLVAKSTMINQLMKEYIESKGE